MVPPISVLARARFSMVRGFPTGGRLAHSTAMRVLRWRRDQEWFLRRKLQSSTLRQPADNLRPASKQCKAQPNQEPYVPWPSPAMLGHSTALRFLRSRRDQGARLRGKDAESLNGETLRYHAGRRCASSSVLSRIFSTRPIQFHQATIRQPSVARGNSLLSVGCVEAGHRHEGADSQHRKAVNG